MFRTQPDPLRSTLVQPAAHAQALRAACAKGDVRRTLRVDMASQLELMAIQRDVLAGICDERGE